MSTLKRIGYRLLPSSLIGLASAAFVRPRRTYAHIGEDVIAERLLLELIGNRVGTYVDIGAFHPSVMSTTKRMYDRGWHGVNIEADEHKVGVFKTLRPRDINVCAVVDEVERDAEFFSHAGSKYASTSGLSHDHVSRTASAMGRELVRRVVRTRTLTSILDETGVKTLDFLNIDVEGSEGAILRSVDLERFGVVLVACEVHGSELETILQSEAVRYLMSKGYMLSAWAPPTVFLQPRSRARIRYGADQNEADRIW